MRGFGQVNSPGAYLADPRAQYAQNMMKSGTDTSPVGHWTQGLARMLQGYLGGKMQGQLRGERSDANQAMNAYMSAMLKGEDQSPDAWMNKPQMATPPITFGGEADAVSDPRNQQPLSFDTGGSEINDALTGGNLNDMALNAFNDEYENSSTRHLKDIQPTIDPLIPGKVGRDPASLPAESVGEAPAGGAFYNQVPQQAQGPMRQSPMDASLSQLQSLNTPYAQNLMNQVMQMQMGQKQREDVYKRGRRDTMTDQDRAFGRQKELVQMRASAPRYGQNTPYPENVVNQKIDIARAGAPQWIQGQDAQGNPMQVNQVTGEMKAMPRARVSEAQKASDRAFGKKYAEYFAGGGQADAMKGLDQLESVIGRLESGEENLTGPVLGRTPDMITSFTNPAAIDTRELIEEVVQRNLRLILGAQFTEREGERLIARAYNPTLDEKTNAKRVKRLMKSMRSAMAMISKAGEYYEKNNTLDGYKGTTSYKMSDFERAMDGSRDSDRPSRRSTDKPKSKAGFSNLQRVD